MSRLEVLDGESWADFLAAPVSLLVLGRADCTACVLWLEELEAFLAEDETWPHVRFGRMHLDHEGLAGFKKAHPWVADVCELPTNLLYLKGVKKKRTRNRRKSLRSKRKALL